MDKIQVTDRAESIALFRLQILGALARRELRHGELRAELQSLSKQRFVYPGSEHARCYSVTTLERWYYALRRRGLMGLKPKGRDDAGRARALSPGQRTLLADIRREYPHVSVPQIISTLVRDGRLEADKVSASTVRRFFQEKGLNRAAGHVELRTRHRWQADSPGVLWHADVCHGAPIRIDGRLRPLRIHAILDDASRYIVGIRVAHTERESDMLRLLVSSWRTWGRSDLLYLDNGPTYRGETLATACARLGTTLLHARPYDPQARGKMERFWRTLRQGCLNHLASDTTLADVHARIVAYIGQHYHEVAHASLMGRSPAAVWATRKTLDTSEDQMRNALVVRTKRRVNGDNTLNIGGVVWEAEQGFLAGHKVTVARTLLDMNEPPWIEHEDRKFPLHIANPTANARRRRQPETARKQSGIDVLFDPTGVLMAAHQQGEQ